METLKWKWIEFWRETFLELFSWLIFWIPLGLIGALIVDLIFRLGIGLGGLLKFGFVLALYSCIITGLAQCLIGGFTDTVKADKSSPNQGIELSRKNSLAVFFVVSLIIRPISWVFLGLLGGPVLGLCMGPMVGVLGGLIAGFDRGGSVVIKHYALRLALWRIGFMPLNLVRFLDHAAKLTFLKKVGGGYIFIHRMLLDYFADIPAQPTSVKR